MKMEMRDRDGNGIGMMEKRTAIGMRTGIRERDGNKKGHEDGVEKNLGRESGMRIKMGWV